MSQTKISDLVDQQTIDKIKELNTEMQTLLVTYTETAKDMAKGLNFEVKVVGDVDKIEKLFNEKSRDAAEQTSRLNNVIKEQAQVIANTTNTISRQLMERERLNKTVREEYKDGEKVKGMVEQLIATYSVRTEQLAKYDLELKKNKESQKSLTDGYEKGLISEEKYLTAQGKLIAKQRELQVEKSSLQQLMKVEEKMNHAQEGSYNQLSQQLELLKKTYKEFSDAQKNSDMGKEFERSIQELDAHLKDLSADMGEFQRNVGNYAIAGQNGVATTESVIAAISQQAITTQDLVDQTKILEEAKARLNTQDERYGEVLAMLNEKIALNKATLTDVSDIIDVEARSVAQAEEQNKRLTEALKNIDVTSEGAQEKIKLLNSKIEENNRFLKENSVAQESAKKDLKELVLEISNLTIQYNSLSEAEKQSADGQALKSHIQDLIERAGVLKDAIADTNRAITNASSDTRTFDQLSEGAQLAANSFGLLKGTAAALGIESGSLEEVQTKLLAAITLSNSASKIQNALQKESAIMQGVLNVQTRLRTVAENLHTASMGRGVVMTKLLTAAQWGFNAAANANPIGLLIVGITALIASGYGLVKLFKSLSGDSEEVKKSYEKQVEALEELGKAHDRIIERLKAKGAVESEIHTQTLNYILEEKTAQEDLLKSALKIYGKDSEEYKNALDKKKDYDKEFSKAKEDAQNYLEKIIHQTEEKTRENALGTYEYKRELVKNELKMQMELLSKLLEIGQISWEQYQQMEATLKLTRDNSLKEINDKEAEEQKKKSQDAVKARQDEMKKIRDAVRLGEDALLNLITDSHEREKKAEQYHYERRLKDLEEQLSKVASKNIAVRDAINNQIKGLQAEHLAKLEAIESASTERRLNAQESFINNEMSIVKEGSEEQMKLSLELLKIRHARENFLIEQQEKDNTLTIEQAEIMRANLVEKYAEEELKIIQDYENKKADLIQKETAKQSNELNNQYVEEVNYLKLKYAEDLKAVGNNQRKRESLEIEFNRKMEKLSQDLAVNTAKAQIDMLEKILESTKLSADKRYEIEQELAKKRLELEGLVADGLINQQTDVTNNQISNLKEWWDNLDPEEKAQFVLDTASKTIGSISELTNALFDRQIQQLDDLMTANTEAGEKETERITELVEKQVITEEEGEARKRAAEAKTAKENEKLEKKKAELQRKQAIFQKATDLAQAGISTALAITNALTTSPFPLGLAMAAIAGAMGAVQIATILATPIPKYAKGTDYHHGGPAIVGDGGVPEVIVYHGGAWMTPDTPTLVDIPRGATVLPDVRDFETTLPALPLDTKLEISSGYKPFNDSGIKKKIDELAYLAKMQLKARRSDNYLLNYELFKSRI